MKKNIDTTQKVFQIALSVLTGIVAVQFIIQVWWLFLSGGEHPYTVESVSDHFAMIKGYGAWILLVIVGGVVFPKKTMKPVGAVTTEKTLEKLRARLPDDTQTAEMKDLQKGRKILCWVGFAVCVIAAVCILVLMLNPAYEAAFAGAFFQSHTEAEKLVWVTALSIAAFGCCIAVKYINENSRKQEIALVKTVIAENAKQGIKAVQKEKVEKLSPFAWFGTKNGVLISRIALGAIALVFVVVGIFNGGMADVLEKAVQICTQCIGLG